MAAMAAHPLPPGTPMGPDGLDLPALHRLAGQWVSDHAAAPAASGDAAAFLARLAAMPLSELQTERARQQAALQRRIRTGRLRLIDGAPADPLLDVANMLAPLLDAGRASDAGIVANRYLDLAPQGATGWALLPLFLATAAAARGSEALAQTILAPAPQLLVAVGGLSGTGKSTVARLLGSRIGRAPGARVLRSDVFRKRLKGVSPETRLPPHHYTRHSDEATYEALFESADDHLGCGSCVILDAVFMSRSERDVAEMLADRARVPFVGIWLEAPERDRIARIVARSGDASDASAAVARDQSRRSVGELARWHRIRANRPIDAILLAARAALDRSAG